MEVLHPDNVARWVHAGTQRRPSLGQMYLSLRPRIALLISSATLSWGSRNKHGLGFHIDQLRRMRCLGFTGTTCSFVNQLRLVLLQTVRTLRSIIMRASGGLFEGGGREGGVVRDTLFFISNLSHLRLEAAELAVHMHVTISYGGLLELRQMPCSNRQKQCHAFTSHSVRPQYL